MKKLWWHIKHGLNFVFWFVLAFLIATSIADYLYGPRSCMQQSVYL